MRIYVNKCVMEYYFADTSYYSLLKTSLFVMLLLVLAFSHYKYVEVINRNFMMFIAVILIIVITVGTRYLISYYRKRLSLIEAANALPGPNTLPILGNAYYFLQRDFNEFLNSIYSLTKTYPSPFRFWLGNNLVIFISEPDQVKTILQSQSCLNKNALYNPFKAWLGTGVFTAPDAIWKTHRKMIASSFNTNILRIFCDTFVEQAKIFVNKLEHMTDREIDMLDHITMCTLDIVYTTSLGVKLELQSNKSHRYVKALSRVKEIILHRIRNVFLAPDIIFNLTPLKREERQHLDFIHSAADEVIQQKENMRNNTDFIEGTKHTKRVFLDSLMEASNEGKKFTRKDLHDEINTMCLAGTDTTAVTMNFLTFMLGNFPEVQEKVYEELLDIYGTQDLDTAPIQFEDLQHMNYLERVIKETLRLFPVAPLIGRRINKDIQIGEYTLPMGADTLIIILHMHRNEKYWLNALKFDPDRFLPENLSNIHPYCYIPFSNGPRNCIGIRYAMTSIKVIIATLLRTYIIKVDKKLKIDEIKLKMDIMLAPYEPLKVRIEKRT